jgi:DNA-directed RNA polymerase specialized sigma24 family protein
MAEDPVWMREALDMLTPQERLICIWKIAGFSSRQIAQHEGRSVADVDKLFAGAKRKLQRALRQHTNDDRMAR